MGETQQWTPLAEKVIANGLYGLVIGMAFFILALFREWIVMGAHYRATAKDRDEYKALNRSSEETAKKTLELLADMSRRMETRP